MTAKEVSVGLTYEVLVSDKLVPVTLNRVCEWGGWYGTNLKTGHTVRIATAEWLEGEALHEALELCPMLGRAAAAGGRHRAERVHDDDRRGYGLDVRLQMLAQILHRGRVEPQAVPEFRHQDAIVVGDLHRGLEHGEQIRPGTHGSTGLKESDPSRARRRYREV